MGHDQKSYPMPVRSGLVHWKHRAQMSMALWEFLKLYDMITHEFFEDGVCWGRVYGGAPIKVKQIAEALRAHPNTCLANLARLESFGYIRRKRTPHGFIIEVKNSFKFHRRDAHDPGTPKDVNHKNSAGESQNPGIYDLDNPGTTQHPLNGHHPTRTIEIILTPEEAQCWRILEAVPGFPKRDLPRTRKLREYVREFHQVDPVALCKNYAAYTTDRPLKKNAVPISQLRRFFVNARDRGWGPLRKQEAGDSQPEERPLSTVQQWVCKRRAQQHNAESGTRAPEHEGALTKR